MRDEFALLSSDDAYLLLMRSLNYEKRTTDALSVAKDVLDMLGVEASWLHQGESSEKVKFRKKISV